MAGARIFVAIVFVLLGASFIASSALLIYEFQQHGLVRPARGPQLPVLLLPGARHPGIGCVLSSVRHLHGPLLAPPALRQAALLLRHGRSRGGSHRLCQVSRQASALDLGGNAWLRLQADRGDQASRRVPILAAMADVREKSQSRIGLSSFARPCTPDPLLEVPDEMAKERYCFPAQARLNGTACCAVQAKFTEAVGRLHASPATRSLSAQIDASAVPAAQGVLRADRGRHRPACWPCGATASIRTTANSFRSSSAA